MEALALIGIISGVGYLFSIGNELVRKTHNPRYHFFLGLSSFIAWYNVNAVMAFTIGMCLILYTGAVLIYHHTDTFEV